MDQVIIDEARCKDASVKLGKSYGGKVYYEIYPAGCFSISRIYFNTHIVPSSTTPSPLSAGICMKGSSSIVFLPLLIYRLYPINPKNFASYNMFAYCVIRSFVLQRT